MLAAADRDTQISVIRNTPTTNSLNEKVESWAELHALLWAQYLPGGGNEKFSGASRYSEVVGRFRLPAGIDITRDDRIVAGGITYEILALDTIERRATLEIAVKATIDE